MADVAGDPGPSGSGIDPAADWSGYARLDAVQELLDRNKLLISEINQNHQLRTAEALVRNVSLIRELNGNVAAVVEAYKELSSAMEGGPAGEAGGNGAS